MRDCRETRVQSFQDVYGFDTIEVFCWDVWAKFFFYETKTNNNNNNKIKKPRKQMKIRIVLHSAKGLHLE